MLQSEHFDIVSLGSHAAIPRIPGLETARAMTHIEALELDDAPAARSSPMSRSTTCGSSGTTWPAATAEPTTAFLDSP
jgi:hypothetical protein